MIQRTLLKSFIVMVLHKDIKFFLLKTFFIHLTYNILFASLHRTYWYLFEEFGCYMYLAFSLDNIDIHFFFKLLYLKFKLHLRHAIFQGDQKHTTQNMQRFQTRSLRFFLLVCFSLSMKVLLNVTKMLWLHNRLIRSL